tara:strand:+ start:303 stop:533 length:231 start_codon:yes stop_codon:yes gene_type:complete
MTPKEKARELVERFMDIKPTTSDKLKEQLIYDEAKQCALICVDEMIKFIIEKQNESMYFEMDLKYWQEVKREINNL